MTKDEFVSLQLLHQQSGKSLKRFLKEAGICYSRYHYWDKKYSTWPSGYIFVDQTGTSSYDLFADYIIHGGDSTFMEKRLAYGQAILQSSYLKLEELLSPSPHNSSCP
jgi:hypothetical protein